MCAFFSHSPNTLKCGKSETHHYLKEKIRKLHKLLRFFVKVDQQAPETWKRVEMAQAGMLPGDVLLVYTRMVLLSEFWLDVRNMVRCRLISSSSSSCTLPQYAEMDFWCISRAVYHIRENFILSSFSSFCDLLI